MPRCNIPVYGAPCQKMVTHCSTSGVFSDTERMSDVARRTMRGYLESMKPIIAVMLLVGCATTATTNPYQYDELQQCPVSMTEEQRSSGVVRCRAMCSSYGRDFDSYTDDCKCWCAPAHGGGGKRPVTKAPWNGASR